MSFIKRLKMAFAIFAYFIIGFAILGLLIGIPVAVCHGYVHWAWGLSMLVIPVLVAVCSWLLDVAWNSYAKIGDQKSGKDFCRKYRKNH